MEWLGLGLGFRYSADSSDVGYGLSVVPVLNVKEYKR